jgi:DNA-binding GntR family transcriptional regulator
MPPTLDLTALDGARLSEAVYQYLLEAILDGSFKPGEVLSELALAKALAVSRTPIHDAVRQLVKDGLVVQEPNRRAVVTEFTADDIREVFEMRTLLEGESAYQAASRLDRASLADLRTHADRLASNWGQGGWLERWADYDEHFHGTIARAAGNGRLRAEVLKYRVLHRGLNKTHTAADLLRHALDEHYTILEALERRAADAARTAMIAHIREWQRFFVNRTQTDARD